MTRRSALPTPLLAYRTLENTGFAGNGLNYSRFFWCNDEDVSWRLRERGPPKTPLSGTLQHEVSASFKGI